MAIYHLSAQVISRSKGQSVVAAAAYRSGDRLTDERTGEEKFYQREIQPDSMILTPANAPDWTRERDRLWNEVELAEKRKDAQLAREMNIALPVELNHHQQKELIKEYVQNEFVNKGMIADLSIHRDDPSNPHAHVMLTTREISAEGFGKKNRDWNDRSLLERWREEWSEHANKALEKAGVQERISHLSHEARGLEQLPTVHLGHVAHEMEKRGVKTERGDLNRERQEYNRIVVDLEKYRSEKKALEQKIRLEQFNTPSERASLKEASKLLKAEPSFSKIDERNKQLDKWVGRLDNNTQYLRWKEQAITAAANHYKWINSFENKIREAEQQIENINWLNPLKVKENRITKERAEQTIARAKADISLHDNKLNHYREKLDFTTKQEFNQVKENFITEQPGLLEKNRNARRHIHQERKVLDEAEKSLKKAHIRQVASLYPKHPKMRYMSYQTAQNLVGLYKANGNKVVPLEKIEKITFERKQEINRLGKEINHVEKNQSRLKRAGEYLKSFEKHHAVVEKYENNPYLKGKMLISKSAKQEYEKAVSSCDHYQSLMKSEGVSGRKDFEKQTDILIGMENKIPAFQEQIKTAEKGMDLLEAITKGIEQAGRNMQREQKQQQRTKSKGKSNAWERER